MSADITFHHVTQIKIKPDKGTTSEWVDLTILQKDGSETEITLFFDQRHQHQMFLEQVGLAVLV